MLRSVLIVEDDDDTRETLEILLAGQFDCRSAASRDQAFQIIKAGFNPACTLMDYSMPGMSLEQFMQQVRSYSLEVVLVSAHSDMKEIGRRLGIKHLLAKPVRAEDLLAKINAVVGSGEHAAI
jgi:CheY-like chemotaxis protein